MAIYIIESFFNHFDRNMMIIHLCVALLFLILWQLKKHNIRKGRKSELIFGIGAITYGFFLISYYIYYRMKK